MDINPFLATDGYKTGHVWMYPRGTSIVYSNLTPRSLRHAPDGITEVVAIGQQMTVMFINHLFTENFFNKPKKKVCGEVKEEYSMYLGTDYDVSHIEDLHDLGYLPITFKALPEGTRVPMGIPILTLWNTKKKFYWVTNFLETILSNLAWKPTTSASIADKYRQNLTKWAMKTDSVNVGFVQFQGHDFSMRGMDSLYAAAASGFGHATSFVGSDSLPVVWAARKFYGETGPVIHSVNASEHSVICAGGDDSEIDTFRYLMKQFPTGILSLVSDTWDLWYVLLTILPQLKDEILNRDGKIVIRPDSGNPVDIICGINTRPVYRKLYMVDGLSAYNDENDTNYSEAESKGVIETLWDLFGGTINEQGYKVLDPHIGAIYGDAITLERAEQICERLEKKGFASTNVILGIGSYTYQYNTRDTFGFAMKATYVEINGVGREIFKDPITDRGSKKSAKGLLCVVNSDQFDSKGHVIIDGETHEPSRKLELIEQCSWETESAGVLQVIFKDGEFFNQTTLTEIRKRVQNIK